MTVLMRFFASRSSWSLSTDGFGCGIVSVGTLASEVWVGAGCGPAGEEVSDAFRSDDRREVFFPAVDALDFFVDALDFFLAMGSLTNRTTLPRAEQRLLVHPLTG